jgi:hypothetical protein
MNTRLEYAREKYGKSAPNVSGHRPGGSRRHRGLCRTAAAHQNRAVGGLRQRPLLRTCCGSSSTQRGAPGRGGSQHQAPQTRSGGRARDEVFMGCIRQASPSPVKHEILLHFEIMAFAPFEKRTPRMAHAGLGSLPLSSSGWKTCPPAISSRAASTWPHTFQSRTPRTRPSLR